MTKVGLQQDLEDTRQIKGEELIYMAPKSGCVKRACKKLLGDDLQTEVEVDFSTREDVFDRLNKGGALSGGTLTYVESVHDATDYLLFPAHGAFDNEIPLPMSLYDGEV